MRPPILYSFRRCPYAMRARVALYYSGQSVELREVVLKNKPPQMLDVSEKGTVPVLVFEDAVIDESLHIMQWALEQNDPDQWLACVGGSLLEHDLVQTCDNDFKPILDKYKYFDRYPDMSQQEYLQLAMPFLARLDQCITRNAGFLGRETFSAIDAAVFPFIRQFAHCDRTLFSQLPFSALQSWLEICVMADHFLGVMKKYPAWSLQANNSVILDWSGRLN